MDRASVLDLEVPLGYAHKIEMEVSALEVVRSAKVEDRLGRTYVQFDESRSSSVQDIVALVVDFDESLDSGVDVDAETDPQVIGLLRFLSDRFHHLVVRVDEYGNLLLFEGEKVRYLGGVASSQRKMELAVVHGRRVDVQRNRVERSRYDGRTVGESVPVEGRVVPLGGVEHLHSGEVDPQVKEHVL